MESRILTSSSGELLAFNIGIQVAVNWKINWCGERLVEDLKLIPLDNVTDKAAGLATIVLKAEVDCTKQYVAIPFHTQKDRFGVEKVNGETIESSKLVAPLVEILSSDSLEFRERLINELKSMIRKRYLEIKRNKPKAEPVKDVTIEVTSLKFTKHEPIIPKGGMEFCIETKLFLEVGCVITPTNQKAN